MRRTVTLAEESGTETASVGHFVAQGFKGGLPRLGRAQVSLGTSNDGLHDRMDGDRRRQPQARTTNAWDVRKDMGGVGDAAAATEGGAGACS